MRLSESRLLSALLAIALACDLAGAITFDFKNARLGNYTFSMTTRTRQVPYERVGVFGADTWQVQKTGRDYESYVDVNLVVLNPPHQFFEVFVYQAEFMENNLWKAGGSDTHACSDHGQKAGAYLPFNYTDYGVIIQGIPMADGSISVVGRSTLKRTGLYIITMNACRYMYFDWTTSTYYDDKPAGTAGISTSRVLVTGDWGGIRIFGGITVRNPYGFVPGQSYGAIPFYAIWFLATIVVLTVLLCAIFYIGYLKVVSYHWMLVVMMTFSCAAYMFIVIYFGLLNETNRNDLVLFGFAQVLLIVRGTATRLIVFFLASGIDITRRDLELRTKVIVFAGGFVYFMALIILLAISELSGDDSAADHARIVSAQGMGARQGLQAAWFIFEIVIAIVVGVALHKSMKETTKANDVHRHKLFQRTAVLLTIYAAFAFIWFLYSTFAPFGVGTLNESNWQSWWFQAAAWEIGYLEVIVGCVIIWFPSKESMAYIVLGSNVTDNSNYAGVGGPPGVVGGGGGPIGQHQSPAAPASQFGRGRGDAYNVPANGEGYSVEPEPNRRAVGASAGSQSAYRNTNEQELRPVPSGAPSNFAPPPAQPTGYARQGAEGDVAFDVA